jgi:hypothetical protein
MTAPADELRAAAFQLRNPFHAPGLKVGIDPDLGAPLAAWLDYEAGLIELMGRAAATRGRTEHVLAVARVINGGTR